MCGDSLQIPSYPVFGRLGPMRDNEFFCYSTLFIGISWESILCNAFKMHPIDLIVNPLPFTPYAPAPFSY